MSNFPSLRTGATLQYPATRIREYSTQVFRFVDGTEQRYRSYSRPLNRWIVRFDLLDEAEMHDLGAFFQAEDGRLGSFAFQDPWSGAQYPACSLGSDEAALEFSGDDRGKATFIVEENRS